MQGLVELLITSLLQIHTKEPSSEKNCKSVKVRQNYSHVFVASLFWLILHVYINSVTRPVGHPDRGGATVLKVGGTNFFDPPLFGQWGEILLR